MIKNPLSAFILIILAGALQANAQSVKFIPSIGLTYGSFAFEEADFETQPGESYSLDTDLEYKSGVSLGGMICTEMAHFLNPEKVFIISSAKKFDELPVQYKIQKDRRYDPCIFYPHAKSVCRK